MTQRPSYASFARHESFSHERLRLAENSIRLFQVQGGQKNDPISLRITQYSSLRRPVYRAISYTWGSTVNLCDIFVNGRAFKIHHNLWTLLLHLRQRKETSFLWADALCIDQANLRERNFHVQLMGKIYDQATSVIVWLGLPSPDRTEIRALDFIKDITLFRKAHGDERLAKTFLTADARHRWETLSRMCQHRYWTRTWIVQEFLRAPAVEVVCGAASINWDEFEALLLAIQNAPFNANDVVSYILQSRTARLTLRRRARTASTLHELLGEYHDSMCTEQRDKVYGILGLASDCGEDESTGHAIGIIPDYNKHIVEVYLDAVACIEKSLAEPSLLPSVINLVRQTLLLGDAEITDYINSAQLGREALSRLSIAPEYVGIVDRTFAPYSSIRDLKLQLSSIDWGQYLGYEVKSSRPGPGKRSSVRPVHSAIPEDLLQNVIKVAETEPEVMHLHNYPLEAHLNISPAHIALHVEDKRQYENTHMEKPRLIIEYNPQGEVLRLGLACINTRQGDLFLQFRGLDTAVVCRQINDEILLVGKAIMIKHCQLQPDYPLDPVCVESPWLSPCLCRYNPNNIELDTDALSLAELLTRR